MKSDADVSQMSRNVTTRDLRIVLCVRIKSRIESAVYTTQAITPSNELGTAGCTVQAHRVFVTNESDARN